MKFTRTYVITVTGEAERPAGAAGKEAELRQVKAAIRQPIIDAVEAFFQTRLTGVTVEVKEAQ